MTNALAVRFSLRAADEIEAADRWWRLNRPAAAGAIAEELQRRWNSSRANPQRVYARAMRACRV